MTADRFQLGYNVNGGDPQRFDGLPLTVSRIQAREALRRARIACKQRGYTVRTLDTYGSFEARRGDEYGCAWMHPVEQAQGMEWEQSA